MADTLEVFTAALAQRLALRGSLESTPLIFGDVISVHRSMRSTGCCTGWSESPIEYQPELLGGPLSVVLRNGCRLAPRRG